MHLVDVVLKCRAGLQAQRVGQGLGGDEGVAVAVAADPVAHAEKRPQAPGLAVLARKEFVEVLFELDVQARHLAEKGAVVIRQGVLDLVGHAQLGVAQQPCLPQLGDTGAQFGVDVAQAARRLRLVALGQQAGDHALGIEQAFALHLGGVGGEHGRDERMGEKILDLRRCEPGLAQLVQRGAHAAGLGFAAGQLVGMAAAQYMPVFGDVGEDGKVAERANHAHRLVARQALQQLVERASLVRVAIAVESH